MNKQLNPKTLEGSPFPRANGKITFDLGWRWAWLKVTFYGGPFPHFKPSADNFGLNLRAEKHHDCDAYLPIADFDTPTQEPEKVADTLDIVIRHALMGNDVYVGCMGGWGRTGLALSLIAKVFGEDQPVAFVRKHYSDRAVETSRQHAYVQDFDVHDLRKELQKAAWGIRIRSILPF